MSTFQVRLSPFPQYHIDIASSPLVFLFSLSIFSSYSSVLFKLPPSHDYHQSSFFFLSIVKHDVLDYSL